MRVRGTALLLASLVLALFAGLAAPTPASAAETPVGTIVPWGGTAVPAGWLRANGAEVSRTTYPELFAVIGTTYGSPSTTAVFDLPNLTGSLPLGKTALDGAFTGGTIGTSGGAFNHTHGVPSHAHSITADAGHAHQLNAHSHTIPRHYHVNFSGVSMTAGGSHSHTAAGGGNFMTQNSGATAWRRAGTGTIPITIRAATSAAGNHQHTFSGNIGPGTGPDGDLQFDTTADASAAGTVGAHSHGGATGAAADTTSGGNPPFQAVDYLIQADSSATTPCGAIWGTGRTAASPGAVLAQGAVVSRATYSTLSGCLGVAFGAGDGSTTFGLPNLVGRFALGRTGGGAGSTMGEVGGSLGHGHTQSHPHSIGAEAGHTVSLPAHGHSTPGHNHNATIVTSNDGDHTHNPNAGGNFIGSRDGGFVRGSGGTRDFGVPANTSTDGGHNHVVDGDVGDVGSGNNGNGAVPTNSDPAVVSFANALHAHGGTTTAPTTGTSGADPAFRTMNFELQTSNGAPPAVGTITPFAGTGEPQAGWVIADGRPLNRTSYSGLFSAIGTTYGAGDGSTTFNVPDMRGRFALGATGSGGTLLGQAGGTLDHDHTAPHTPATSTEAAHAHTTPGHAHTSRAHFHRFSKTFGSAGAHNHAPWDTDGGFWSNNGGTAASNVTECASCANNISNSNLTDGAWGTHRHTSILGGASSVGATGSGNNGNNAQTTGTTAPNTDSTGAHAHTVGGATPTTNANNPAYQTVRYMIRISGAGSSSPAPITDNQAGDTTWRNSNSGSYDVDFADPSGVARFETNVWSGAGQSGIQREAWTQVAAPGVQSYTANWGLLASTWTAMAEGTNYVSVRMWTTGNVQTASLVDAFYVRKDTVAPTDVTAAATTPTLVAPAVTWGAATDATSGIAYYRVFRGASSTGPWTQVSTDGVVTGTSFTDSAAPFGTHFYLVRAVDLAGNVASGGTASGAVVYHRAPSLPVHASPANAATNTSLSPVLTASYSDPDAHTGTLAYRVCSDSGCTGVVATGSTASSASGTSPPWTVSVTLTRGTTYYWQVRATDAIGASSAWTGSWSFTTSAGPSIVDNQAGDTTWRSTNVAAYDVDFTDALALANFETSVWTGTLQGGSQLQGWTQVATLSGTSATTNWSLLAGTWATLPEGTSYVSVRVTNSLGISTTLQDAFYVRRDNTAAAPSGVIDGSPTDIAFSASTSAIAAQWTASSGEAGLSGVNRYEYCIATGTGCSGSPARSWTSVGATTSVSATGLALTDGATYYIAVRMVDNAGNTSAAASSNGFRVDASAPPAPTQVSPPAGSIQPTWPALVATYVDTAPATAGQLTFQVCSDSACTSVVGSGASAAGLATSTNGSWTPALADGSYWWRAQSTDSAGNVGAWSPAWPVQIGGDMLDISVPNVALGLISPGASTVGTATVSVSSDAPNGYQVQAADTSNTIGIAGAANVPDWTGTVATPSVWPTATYGYFGLSVLSAPGGRQARWGTAGGPFPSNDFVNNSYAGLTTTPQTIHLRAGFDPSVENIGVAYRFAPTALATAGNYTANVTFTVIANP